ncbi:hypothetical protein [Spirochaeta cellobiosiphila]|uniref:hypothetical protein n=1 Tax=Spirochaeta cellobiosiphila TaxID=504483 RepID=UPI00042A71BB|nr:hypothetical protein [Spirochaeta cellobiosiphila]
MDNILENSPSLGIFEKVYSLYNEESILYDTLNYILMVSSQILNIANILISLTVYLINKDYYKDMSNYFLLALVVSLSFMTILVLRRQYHTKKVYYKITGVKKNPSSHEMFYVSTKYKEITEAELKISKRVANFNLEILNPEFKPLAPISFFQLVYIPFIISLVTINITGATFDGGKALMIFIFWIPVIGMSYWIIERFFNRKFYNLQLFVRHIEVALLGREEC